MLEAAVHAAALAVRLRLHLDRVLVLCAYRGYSLGVNIQTNKNAPAKKKYEYEVGRATFLVFLKRTLWMSWCTLSGPRLNISLHSVMTCGTRAS